MSHNAFESFENALATKTDEQVAEMVSDITKNVPPEDGEAEAIEGMLPKLRAAGLSATAAFYERLLAAKREAQKG